MKIAMRSPIVFLFLTCSVLPPASSEANSGENSTPVPGPKLSISENHFWMKRGFAQGQPELQQAMNNMLVREQMIKRNLQFPPVDVDGYPALLTQKTAYLLAQAEHMLNRVKNLRERRWVEVFIQRLKALAFVLKQSLSNEGQSKRMNITERGIKTLGRTPAPETHLPFTSSISASTSELSEGQNAASESPMAQLNQEVPPEGQVVAKPGLIQQLRNKKLDEDDELVRELESLHHVVALEQKPQNSTPPNTTTNPPDLASSVPPPKRMTQDKDIENEKDKIKNILAHEVAALQRLGGSPEEIMNTLRFDGERSIGFKDPESGFNQNPNTQKEVHSYETEKNMGNMNVQDVHSEESMVSKANGVVWRPSTLVHPASHPSKDMYMNKSFHMNLPPRNQQTLEKGQPKNLPYSALHLSPPNGIKNTIQKLQRQEYEFNNHVGQTFQNDHHGPVETKQKHFLQQGSRNKFNPPLGRSGTGNRHGYSPYPYFPNTNHKNSTMYGSQIFPSHNIDNNLSDEMKRQLRDGKVILLSDSVVRSNFEQTPEKGNKIKKRDEIIKSEEKNETQAQH